MTLLDIRYRYGRPPGEPEMRALKDMREVYGIWRISFDEPSRVIRVEYDASRLEEHDISFLLRNAGLDLVEKLPPVAPGESIAA
jgi:hypothetical protein